MKITVKQLIKLLKKYPQDSYIGIQAHDNDENELQLIVSGVSDYNPEESFDNDFCSNVYVVLH